MKALLVHPGTQHSLRLARELERLECLGRFWTGLAYVPNSVLGHCIKCSPTSLQRNLSNRRLDGVPGQRLRTRPFTELRAQRLLRAGHDDQEVFFNRNRAFQRLVSRKELVNSDVVIGFDTSSWLLAQRASALGRPFLLDQSSPHALHYETILPVLSRQFPEWAEEFAPRIPQFLTTEQAEHKKASRIVVASSFTRKTLVDNGVSAEKIVVIPYGVDLTAFSPVPRRERPLRFVFVGTLRGYKGVPLLLQVWQSLQPTNAELWLVGPVSDRVARLIPRLPGLRVVGKVPHCELAAVLQQCDVFVFPSYFEGFGLVLLEALAAGLPVIATDATAAPDLITEGREGHVIPVGDAHALREALRHFMNSPDDLPHMSRAARQCAERYSWDAYGERWINLLRQVV